MLFLFFFFFLCPLFVILHFTLVVHGFLVPRLPASTSAALDELVNSPAFLRKPQTPSTGNVESWLPSESISNKRPPEEFAIYSFFIRQKLYSRLSGASGAIFHSMSSGRNSLGNASHKPWADHCRGTFQQLGKVGSFL